MEMLVAEFLANANLGHDPGKGNIHGRNHGWLLVEPICRGRRGAGPAEHNSTERLIID